MLSLPHRVVRTALEMSLFIVILVQPEVSSKFLRAAGGADNRFRRMVSAGVRHERLSLHRVRPPDGLATLWRHGEWHHFLGPCLGTARAWYQDPVEGGVATLGYIAQIPVTSDPAISEGKAQE